MITVVVVALAAWLLSKWDSNHRFTWPGRVGTWRCLWLVDVLHIAKHDPWRDPWATRECRTHCNHCKRNLPEEGKLLLAEAREVARVYDELWEVSRGR